MFFTVNIYFPRNGFDSRRQDQWEWVLLCFLRLKRSLAARGNPGINACCYLNGWLHLVTAWKYYSVHMDWIFGQLARRNDVEIPWIKYDVEIPWGNYGGTFWHDDRISKLRYSPYDGDMVSRPSWLYNLNPYTVKTVPFEWIKVLINGSPLVPGGCFFGLQSREIFD